MLSGAVFDVDGTLLDSMHIWAELGSRYLRQRGLLPESCLARKLFPMSLEESSSYIKERYNISDSPERIVSDTLALLEDFYFHEAPLKPGAGAWLDYLSENGIPMAIATAGNTELLKKALARLGVLHHFRAILSCSTLGTTKLESLIYLKAAQAIGTAPKETAVFEDTLHGLLSAKSAGFITVAVEDPSSESDRAALQREADYYIRDFNDRALKAI